MYICIYIWGLGSSPFLNHTFLAKLRCRVHVRETRSKSMSIMYLKLPNPTFL